MNTYKALIKEGAKVTSHNLKAYTKEDAKEVVEAHLTSGEYLLKIVKINKD